MRLVIWLFASNRKCRVGSLYGEFKIGLSIEGAVDMGALRRDCDQFTRSAGRLRPAPGIVVGVALMLAAGTDVAEPRPIAGGREEFGLRRPVDEAGEILQAGDRHGF